MPSQSELQSCIPAGRMAVAARKFAPPTPAFGPGSVEHTRRQAEALELADDAASADDRSPRNSSSVKAEGAYAGAGSYF